MGKTRKCKTCGRQFVPKGSGDRFCSQLCRTTGCFVGGGGDTSKPMNSEMRRALERKGKSIPAAEESRPKRVTGGAEKFPKVHYMFSLPMSERFAVTKTFTPEEAEYCRRLMKKKLIEERKFDDAIDWESGFEERESLGSYEGIVGGRLGDSDDGTV